VSVSSPNPPGWSLSAEAFFYALFPAMVPLGQRLAKRGVALALGADLGLMVLFYGVARAAGPGQPLWLGNFPAFQLGFFVAGMLTARTVREGVRFPPLAVAVGAMASLCAVFYVGAARHVGESTDLPLVELVALPFMLMLLGSAANADLQGRPSPFRAPWLVTLGVWSYALYLVQIACFVVASCILRHGLSSNQLIASLEAIIFIVGAIAVAGLAHRFIELPCNARLRHAPPAIIEQEQQRPEPTGALL
jgi:peptidoglycan/LPS O-acetylase OafA/YrhL